ncbi:hypothetical protein PHLCEN_2v5967 [Hermanssonia centrifuga]|uniref:ATP-dependent DNA helicase n=1 Tax=Hermanssonia centrifuga TaxID=98765 RepID=A0A2R6P1D7_9APHY|nr:hypothetical protein PHLCEN_2v5967 [Hermanssonia centrifuga]
MEVEDDARQISPRELVHAKHAIEVAKGARIFMPGQDTWMPTAAMVSNATGNDLTQVIGWQAQMQADVLCLNGEDGPVNRLDTAPENNGAVKRVDGLVQGGQASVEADASSPQGHETTGVLTAADPAMLKDDQFQSFDIVHWHLGKTLAGNNPPPLRMILYGEEGTGKSKVIQTISEEFVARGTQSMLMKAAYTGVAASLIDGKTTHTIAALSVKRKDAETVSDGVKNRLQAF